MQSEALEELREAAEGGAADAADAALAAAREAHDDYVAALWAVQLRRAEVGAGDRAWATVARVVGMAVDAAAEMRDGAFDLRAEAMADRGVAPPVRRDPGAHFELRLAEAQRDLDAARVRVDHERGTVNLLLAGRAEMPWDAERERLLAHAHDALAARVLQREQAFDRLAGLRSSLWVSP